MAQTQQVVNKAAFFKTVGYEPHAGQDLYHDSTARFRLANCGRRFGKSTMAGRDLEPRMFLKDKLFWIVGPTYDLGEKEFRVIWKDLIIGKQFGKDKRVKRAYNKKQGTMFIEFPWGNRLEVRSAQHPENLVGDALDHVILSEAAKHNPETWTRFIQPALSDKHGTADFPTTPEGYNWLYDLWMYGQDKTIPEYQSWRFPSWANTEVYPGGIDDPEIVLLRRTMPPEAFDQEIGAEFGSFVGKIYPDWDVNLHVTNVSFHPEWPSYVAFDWGYTNPLAAIFFQVSPMDEIFIWREWYKPYMRVEEHCRHIREGFDSYPDGYHLDLAFGDAADPEAAATVAEKLVPIYALPEAKENWRDGIDLVRSFMQREDGEDEFGGPIYKPALHVDFSCMQTIREFNNYKAPPKSNGRNAQEIGLRQDDHAMDAIRYGLVHIFRLGATYHLTDVMELNRNQRREVGASALDSLPTGSVADSEFALSLNDSSGGFFSQGGDQF